MTQQFIVKGLPKGKGRPRVTRHGTYTPKATRDFEESVAVVALLRGCNKIEGPVQLDMHAYFPIPKSVSKTQRERMDGTYHTKRPDTDNILKAVLDALNGIAWEDDSAVMLGSCAKFYTKGEPYVEITITPI